MGDGNPISSQLSFLVFAGFINSDFVDGKRLRDGTS